MPYYGYNGADPAFVALIPTLTTIMISLSIFLLLLYGWFFYEYFPEREEWSG